MILLHKHFKVFLTFVLFILFTSCEKEKKVIDDEKNIETKLFDLSSVNDIDILDVANNIKKEGKEKNYF